jgi:hypothetical protein
MHLILRDSWFLVPDHFLAKLSHLVIALTRAVQVEGLVMTDMQQYYAADFPSKPLFLDGSDLRRWATDCICAVCKQRSINLETGARSVFEDYTLITRIGSPELSEHEYLLCPFEVPAFVFKTRTWGESICQSQTGALC